MTNGISRLMFYQLRFTHWFQQKSNVELLLVRISDHSSGNDCHYRDNTGSALIYLFTLIFLFIFLSLIMLGLHCCVWTFSSCEGGLLFIVVHRLLIVVASLVAEHRF